jgi:hypothetical protein
MAGVSGAIDGHFHIPSILRKDDPAMTEDLVLTDVVNQDNRGSKLNLLFYPGFKIKGNLLRRRKRRLP